MPLPDELMSLALSVKSNASIGLVLEEMAEEVEDQEEDA